MMTSYYQMKALVDSHVATLRAEASNQRRSREARSVRRRRTR
jgi:hypothetical protein